MKSYALSLAFVAALFLGNGALAEVATPSAVKHNKDVARMWYEEAIVKENPKALDDILAEGVTFELAPSYVSQVSGTHKLAGAKQVKDHIGNVNKNADYSGEIIDLVGEGNKVAMYRVVTQKMPDGRVAVVPWVSFFEFNDAGKITKIKHVHDTLHEKNQLEAASKK
jgi:ketosteroid isomerase-like protein